jgi:hypothetical protein
MFSHTTNKFLFVVIFTHTCPIPYCVTSLTIDYEWIFGDVKEVATLNKVGVLQ